MFVSDPNLVRPLGADPMTTEQISEELGTKQQLALDALDEMRTRAHDVAEAKANYKFEHAKAFDEWGGIDPDTKKPRTAVERVAKADIQTRSHLMAYELARTLFRTSEQAAETHRAVLYSKNAEAKSNTEEMFLHRTGPGRTT